ncbi:protein NRT1/ PTR FAMILY 6.2 isoform X2 [Brachypodium distachyon]|uniref:protein NRT1/ PTR FAMILY 6.2 isoform X2 n=1 Tax=Brachypodium distachyon TaxID=15368 RepID=UPI000234DE2B|nr:protein NRT1/ PTR FAMILY 6.2 isoform X2 [Brachypodium distachyon]|eukprot:XP_024315877.1 protein NRT1/ PTR FAMILY 6.2 isoform X2 [Brachypodium distachyon]
MQEEKMETGARPSWIGAGNGNLVHDAVDYHGCPADRSRTGSWVAAALVLGIELCERLATMGIAVNLVTYLTDTMHLPSAESANVVTDFMGTSFLLCLLGGFLADSFLGRFLTIAIFALLQALGTGLLAVSTTVRQLRPGPGEAATGLQMGVLYACLYLIALGTGGLKSSVSGFGTDQFDERDDQERAAMGHFFNRFFFFISLGTLMAVTVLVYVQDHVGRSWAYGICSACMLLAVAVFLSGTRRYRYKRSAGSPIVHILQVLVAAARKRGPIKRGPLAAAALYEDRQEDERIPHTAQFLCLDAAAVMAGEEDNEIGTVGRQAPNPWKLCSVSRVEEVKMVARLMPVWATTILFWTIYAQMITFSVEQATTMDRRMVGSFEIPAASLTVFFVGAIMLTLALYDRIFIPLCRILTGRQGFTSLEKIGIGLALSIAGMAAAAVCEKKRLAVAAAASTDTAVLPISVFMLIPQFLLVGAGEAFIYTGQLDFFITRSPKGMKTMSTGLFLATLSLGFFLSSALVSLVKGATTWLGDTINHSRLDYFYWLLAVLGAVNLAAYLLCAMWATPAAGSSKADPAATAADEKC